MITLHETNISRTWKMDENGWKWHHNATKIYTLPPKKNERSPWKWMVGILVSFWGPALFSGAKTVSCREWIAIYLSHYPVDY